MSSTAIVWMIVGLLTLAVTIAMLIALIRHVFVLGRAAGRFGDEVGPIAREITEQADRASSRAQRIPGDPRRP
jgi:hypothetical protein